MSFTPSISDQEHLSQSLTRKRGDIGPREVRVELITGATLLAATAVLIAVDPPSQVHWLEVLICCAVLALATRVQFETAYGYTNATQLGLVPLLFAAPPALIPVLVALSYVASSLGELANGSLPVRRLLTQFSNAWFALGPATVLVISGTPAQAAGLPLLAVVLLAQFVVDLLFSVLRFWLRGYGQLQLPQAELWIYAVDAALSVIGLLAGWALQLSEFAPLALLPLLWLLDTFAHERSTRLESLLELNETYRGTARVLGNVIEADDGYTGAHTRSVVDLCMEVAARLQLPINNRRNLEFGALLHDVGKIAIPKEILNKPGPLDPAEWQVMRTHMIEGQQLLDTVGGFMHEVGLIVRAHHERWDGSGYPDGLRGLEIPLEARIISACDTWNAMRTNRVYRTALSFEAAVKELEDAAGTQLDPLIVAELLVVVQDHWLPLVPHTYA